MPSHGAGRGPSLPMIFQSSS